MTVLELKDVLSSLPDEMQIVFKPEHSSYVEDFTNKISKKPITSMYGNDFLAFIIQGKQIGRS